MLYPADLQSYVPPPQAMLTSQQHSMQSAGPGAIQWESFDAGRMLADVLPMHSEQLREQNHNFHKFSTTFFHFPQAHYRYFACDSERKKPNFASTVELSNATHNFLKLTWHFTYTKLSIWARTTASQYGGSYSNF